MANNKQRVGKAYAFFNYDLTEKTLARDLASIRRAANFDELTLRVLTDDERKDLRPDFVRAAKKEKVYGGVRNDCSRRTSDKLFEIRPISASKLDYVVEGRAPLESNMKVSAMLDTVLHILGERRYRNDVFRGTTFYKDYRGRVASY